MSKKSKKKSSKVKQNYLPIVVLNNNVKEGKKKVSSNNFKTRRRVYHHFADDLDNINRRGVGGQFTNDKDTVVYIQNYPPQSSISHHNNIVDDVFGRRSGSSSGSGSVHNPVRSTAIQPYIASSDMSSYQIGPVASASSGYGGGGGCGYSGCGNQELSLFEALIFLAALGAAAYFLNTQILMFLGKRRRRVNDDEAGGVSEYLSQLIPWSNTSFNSLR